ncbi:hypothetical protein LT337_32195 (plasmid) [Mycolicibacterium fortuitum]|nr:hypothetical protein LT337_32195 [Mycolicibacterium fortuitum]
MIYGASNPDEYLLNLTKSTGSLMLIRVYRTPAGTLQAHWATGEQDTTEIDPLDVVKIAHSTTGCRPGRRIDPTPGDDEQLATAWEAGYQAAQKYQREREEDRRVFERHNLPWGGLIPDRPTNPYRSTPEWDF